MTKDATSRLTWYHKPFGRRVVSPEHPYFSISQPSDPEDNDALRRRDLSDLAGL
ncbi:MAG TPA: hypothetical protein VGL92_18800 [Acidimicrobiia bacterium]|jgi:hypothetical protein